MYKNLLKIVMFATFMFASSEGFSSSDLNSLYKDRLLPTYESLKPQKDIAKKRRTAYIISSILAVVVFLLFAKFFKLTGIIVAIIMIGAGYFVLMKNSSNVVGDYEKTFKDKIITPIAQNCCGYSYEKDGLDQKIFQESGIFAPRVKFYKSWDLYGSDDAKFTYIKATFDTKESASVERMNENVFEGYFIILNKANDSEGILVSDSLREKVSNMDLEMNSFFANAKRGKKVGNFTIYGEPSQKSLDHVSNLDDKMIAISFKKDKTYIALYKKSNPLRVDPLKDFDLNIARDYESAFKEVSEIVSKIK